MRPCCVFGIRGVGISPDLLPHIFDLFTQAERSLDRSQGGLGIGLTLVQKLIDIHGGRVEAHSTQGQGQRVHRASASAAVASESVSFDAYRNDDTG